MSALLVLTIIVFASTTVNCDYWSKRKDFIKNEEAKMLGGSLVLTEKEKLVNEILMEQKLAEYDEGFNDPKKFIAANHIFDTLEDIEKSEVFKFIKTLPKGSMLHGHDTALVSGDFLYNLTYSQNLYTCFLDGRIQLHFFREPITDNTCDWQTIESIRNTDENFDNQLKSQITLIRPDYRTVYTDINIVWQHFMDIFITVEPLICYKPIFEEYFFQVLEELYADNVMYLEFRSLLPTVYDLDNVQYGPIEVARLYKETLDRFMETHQDFLGAKLIYAPLRRVDNETMDSYLKIARELQTQFPTFLAGFDLVGQEDLGYPLTNFISQIEDLSQDINLFFHAGETNWYGTTTDFNVIDAILLGTKRIGHGYAILKHPDVAQMVKDNGVAIEVCPISNQVLMLINDMRNHPGNYFFANDYPIVITNDDPSFWGTKALSHDWYIAYMGLASRNSDLRFLKQLAINSIIYSTLDNKEEALESWESRWTTFLDDILINDLNSSQDDPFVTFVRK